MSENTKSVAVNILGRVYQIIVGEGEEEEINEAERELKRIIDQFKQSYSYKDDKDLLAMAALQFATKSIFFEKETNKISQNVIKKIKEIDKLFSTSVL